MTFRAAGNIVLNLLRTQLTNSVLRLHLTTLASSHGVGEVAQSIDCNTVEAGVDTADSDSKESAELGLSENDKDGLDSESGLKRRLHSTSQADSSLKTDLTSECSSRADGGLEEDLEERPEHSENFVDEPGKVIMLVEPTIACCSDDICKNIKFS